MVFSGIKTRLVRVISKIGTSILVTLSDCENKLVEFEDFSNKISCLWQSADVHNDTTSIESSLSFPFALCSPLPRYVTNDR